MTNFSVLLTALGPLGAYLDLAHEVEAAGLRRVWVAEYAGPDSGIACALIASQTGLEVGTAVVPVYSRSPALLAMAAGDLAALSAPRPVHLGLGAGGEGIVRRWHGLAFDRPADAVADTIAILRQALAGERTSHHGTVRSSDGFRLAAPAPGVRLYVGGLGPAMRRLAARAADGAIFTWITPQVLAPLAAELRAAANGRDVAVVARAYVAVTDDLAAVRAAVRQEMVEYLSSPPYGRWFAAGGYGEEVAGVQAAFARGDRAASLSAVSDRIVDDMLAAGTADEVAARLQEYVDAGADDVVVQPVAPQRGGDPVATIRAVAAAMAVRA